MAKYITVSKCSLVPFEVRSLKGKGDLLTWPDLAQYRTET